MDQTGPLFNRDGEFYAAADLLTVDWIRHVRLAYQPPASSTFLSQQISHQQLANSTFLSEQNSTRHQPPANRTG
jgi:hypothetical protein